MIKEASFIAQVTLTESTKQKRITVPKLCNIEAGDYVKVILIDVKDRIHLNSFNGQEIDWLDLTKKVEQDEIA